MMASRPRSFCLWFIPLFLVAAGASQAVSEDDAKQTLLRYLEAQRQGDIITMKSLLVGNILETKSPLLSNPAYPEYLSQTFANVDFSVNWTKRLAPTELLIEASIIYRHGDTMTRHYLLRNIAEDDIGDSRFMIYDKYDPDFR